MQREHHKTTDSAIPRATDSSQDRAGNVHTELIGLAAQKCTGIVNARSGLEEWRAEVGDWVVSRSRRRPLVGRLDGRHLEIDFPPFGELLVRETLQRVDAVPDYLVGPHTE